MFKNWYNIRNKNEWNGKIRMDIVRYTFCCNLIEWCNDNEGFLSFMLSLLTILISVIAIIASNKIGKLPYKKDIRAIPNFFLDNDKPVIDLILQNTGNADISIKYINIFSKPRLSIGHYYGEEENILLHQNESKKCKIEIYDNIEEIIENAIDLNGIIIIEIHDISGEKYVIKDGFPVG